MSASSLGHGRSQPASFGRMIRLDGLRGVLAVYVMLGHAAPMIPWPARIGPIVEALVSHGFAAVNLFFALSGLVIVQSLARFEGRALPFLIARGRRVLPVYLLVLGAAMIVLGLGDPLAGMPWLTPGDAAHQIWEIGLPRPLWAHLAVHLTLLQGIMPPHLLPYAAFSLLGPAWSLSAEVQFYLLIALLARRAGAVTPAHARLALGFAGLALIGWVYRQAGPGPWQFSRAFLPNASIYFALGIASVPLLRDNRGGVLFALIALIAMILGAMSGNGFRLVTPLVWALCVLLQKRPDLPYLRPIARALESPVMLWLGAISYPLYLANEPVQRLLALIVSSLTGPNPSVFGWVWGPLALAGPIMMAAALHVTVERKLMRSSSPHRQASAAESLYPAQPSKASPHSRQKAKA